MMKRGDFWNEIFAINKEYANAEGFADIEKSIIEAHDAVGLSWDDTVSVAPGMIENHRAAVKDIFTNMKEKINKRYIKWYKVNWMHSEGGWVSALTCCLAV